MVGVMFPALFGCRTPSALWRVRGLGHALARTPTRGASQTLLAQAAAALGTRGGGAALAPGARQKPGHPEPLAVDLGLGGRGVPHIGGAGGVGR